MTNDTTTPFSVDASHEAPNQYLTFHLGDEVFAMDIRTVREIIQQAAMTVVPLMPNFVRGVINLPGLYRSAQVKVPTNGDVSLVFVFANPIQATPTP